MSLKKRLTEGSENYIPRTPKAGFIKDNPSATMSSVKLNVAAVKLKYENHINDFEKLLKCIEEEQNTFVKGKPKKINMASQSGRFKISQDVERVSCLVPESLRVYIPMYFLDSNINFRAIKEFKEAEQKYKQWVDTNKGINGKLPEIEVLMPFSGEIDGVNAKPGL